MIRGHVLDELEALEALGAEPEKSPEKSSSGNSPKQDQVLSGALKNIQARLDRASELLDTAVRLVQDLKHDIEGILTPDVSQNSESVDVDQDD
jgi:hypothetical protein